MIHLTHYLVHPLMLTVALLAVPLLAFWYGPTAPMPFFTMGALLIMSACGPSILYINAQRELRRDWKRRVLRLPMLMIVGTGIAVSNTRAVIEAVLGIKSGFVRTPKRAFTGNHGGAKAATYRLPLDLDFAIEATLAVYSAIGLILYIDGGKLLIGPFLLLYTLGFGTMAFATLREAFRRLTDRGETSDYEPKDPIRESELAYGETLARYRSSAPVRLYSAPAAAGSNP